MRRRTQIALGLFVCLGAIAVVQYREPERGTRVGEKPRPVPKLDMPQIRQVTLTAKGKTVTLTRVNDKWMVTDPVRWPADKYAAETLHKKLAELSFGDLITEQTSRHAEMEVAGDKAIRVEVSDGKKKLADFMVGKVIDGYTMVMARGKSGVYQAVGMLRGTFERELKHWRDRKVIAVKSTEVRKLSVQTEAGTITIARDNKDGAWKVESSPIQIAKLDKRKISAAISTLQSFSAYDFAKEPAKKDLGNGRVAVTSADGKTQTLQVGPKHGKDERLVKTPDNAQVYIVKDYTLKPVWLRPIDFKDHTMLALKAADIKKITITKSGGPPPSVTFERTDKGFSANGKKLHNAKKITQAIKALANLRADEFASKSESELGLDKPAWTVRISLPDKELGLSIGSRESDSSRAVRVDGVADTYMVRKYVLDRILLDPAQYK